jgi:hypothetical protein
MARLIVFDSGATVDSAGAAVDMALASSAKRSKAVRGFGAPDGDSRHISWEFLLSGTPGSYDIYWYQEFFNDEPSLDAQPTVRTFPGADPTYSWAREQVQQLVGSGVIEHYNGERHILAMSPGTTADVRWFPMLVHAYWTRLAIWTPTALGVTPPRLRVFAHVGGYDAQAVLEAATTPYAGA